MIYPVQLYIIKLNNGIYYTGITKDIEHRLKSHKRTKGLFKLVFTQNFIDYKSARIREKYYKKLNRKRLSKIIAEYSYKKQKRWTG